MKRAVVVLGVAVSFSLLTNASYAERYSESRTFQVHAKVEPVFVVDVSARGGTDVLEFGSIKRSPGETAQAEPTQVDVSVASNLAVPYQVSQTVLSPLANEEGIEMTAGSFKVQTSEAAYGRGLAADPQAVLAGEKILFESDSVGQSDQFAAIYSLEIPSSQASGDYRTQIVYTIATKD